MTDIVEPVNDLVTRATALFDVYDQKSASIDASVQTALATLPKHIRYWTVDQVNGDDENDGTEAAPLASIDRAIELTPKAGACIVNLASDYHFSTIVTCDLNMLGIRADGDVKRKLTFGWVESDTAPGQIKRMAGFQPNLWANFRFEKMEFELPDDPALPFEFGHMNGIVAGPGSNHPAVTALKFMSCDFTFESAASTEATLRGNASGHSILEFASCTYPANMAGRFVKGVGGTGVDPATVPQRVITNLHIV